MKGTYYTLRIGCKESDENWLVDTLYNLQEITEVAEIFKKRGFWISISKITRSVSEVETIVTSTWNTDLN